jgi:hypothetical protein
MGEWKAGRLRSTGEGGKEGGRLKKRRREGEKLGRWEDEKVGKMQE